MEGKESNGGEVGRCTLSAHTQRLEGALFVLTHTIVTKGCESITICLPDQSFPHSHISFHVPAHNRRQHMHTIQGTDFERAHLEDLGGAGDFLPRLFAQAHLPA
eukprot:1144660-Pelagomonas_calceolata.AAC.2